MLFGGGTERFGYDDILYEGIINDEAVNQLNEIYERLRLSISLRHKSKFSSNLYIVSIIYRLLSYSFPPKTN
jgi:hypothetical protein